METKRSVNVVNMFQTSHDCSTYKTIPKHMTHNVWAKIKAWKEISRQRRALRNLSDPLLKDIGISRTDAIREADRTFWDNNPNFDVSLRERGESNDSYTSERSKLTCCVQS